MPLISYDASVGINNKKKKQAAKTSAAAMTRGTRITRATLAARTAQASRPAASGTPSPDNKTSASDNNNSTPYYFGGIPKIKEDACCSFSGPGQNKISRVFFLDGLLNVKDAH